MKSIFIICFTCFTFFSCKKENATNNLPSKNLTYFMLKKDGVPYSANFLNVTEVISDNSIYIEALTTPSNIANNSYALTVRRNIVPGTYAIIEGESSDFSLYHFRDENSEFGPDTGQITIISNDTILKKMHATFELSLYNDNIDEYPVISNGQFEIQY